MQSKHTQNMHRKAISKCPPTNHLSTQSTNVQQWKRDVDVKHNAQKNNICIEFEKKNLCVFFHVNSIDIAYAYTDTHTIAISLICHMFFPPLLLVVVNSNYRFTVVGSFAFKISWNVNTQADISEKKNKLIIFFSQFQLFPTNPQKFILVNWRKNGEISKYSILQYKQNFTTIFSIRKFLSRYEMFRRKIAGKLFCLVIVGYEFRLRINCIN